MALTDLYAGEWDITVMLFSNHETVAKGAKSVTVKNKEKTTVELTLQVYKPVLEVALPPDTVTVFTEFTPDGRTYPVFTDFGPRQDHTAGYIVYSSSDPAGRLVALDHSEALDGYPPVRGLLNMGPHYYRFTSFAAVNNESALSPLTVRVTNERYTGHYPNGTVHTNNPVFQWTGPETFTNGWLIVLHQNPDGDYEELARNELTATDGTSKQWDGGLQPGAYRWLVVFEHTADITDITMGGSEPIDFTVTEGSS